MNKSDIERGLADIIANYTEFDMKTVGRATSLREDLGLSSFDIIALVTEIEEKFSISVDDIDILSEMKTFGEAVDLVANLHTEGIHEGS
ncbi:MAG: acyl carrier protein [Oscillospiraceae bacterium]|nr:acyl carrier protein [Oscillospiraceae bacterium]